MDGRKRLKLCDSMGLCSNIHKGTVSYRSRASALERALFVRSR